MLITYSSPRALALIFKLTYNVTDLKMCWSYSCSQNLLTLISEEQHCLKRTGWKRVAELNWYKCERCFWPKLKKQTKLSDWGGTTDRAAWPWLAFEPLAGSHSQDAEKKCWLKETIIMKSIHPRPLLKIVNCWPNYSLLSNNAKWKTLTCSQRIFKTFVL